MCLHRYRPQSPERMGVVLWPDVEVKDITKRLDLAPELWIGLLNGLEQRDTNILRG